MKRIDKGPPLCCQCPQSCNKSQEVAGSRRDAGLWRRPLCWKVKPPGLLAAAAGSLLHPVLSSPALHPTPRIHLLVRVPTSSSPTHSRVLQCPRAAELQVTVVGSWFLTPWVPRGPGA